ncbi:MAG: glycosyltransferase [Vicinamibacteria bacterium]
MPKTVLYLIDKLHRAGAQRNLSQLARGLDRSRFHPLVVCLQKGGPMGEELQVAGIEVAVLAIERIYGGRALRAIGRLARKMREERVEIVHTYLVSANLFGALASAFAGVPALVTTRRDLGFSRNWRLSLVEETLVNRRAIRVVTPCEAVSESARRERGLSPSRVMTIENGVDLDFFRPEVGLREKARAALQIPPEAAVAGVIGNFLPVKGHEDFLRAAARTGPEVRFVLVGGGRRKPDMERLARELGIEDRALFTGPRSDTREVLSLVDVLVSPSHSEGMSNVILEAMAMARPIVATAVGGTRELLRDGATGLLVPPQDPRSLAEAMTSLLSDRVAAEVMGARARQEAEQRFSLRKMVHRYMALYDEVLAAVGSSTSS